LREGWIKLVLADVDGTLVTHAKVLTLRAIAGAQALADAGIAFEEGFANAIERFVLGRN